MAPKTSKKKTPPPPQWWSPFLPTYMERTPLYAIPILLMTGSMLAQADPSTVYMSYDPITQAQITAKTGFQPFYFARKSNAFNVYFVKKGWAWVTFALFMFMTTYPGVTGGQMQRAFRRWMAVTAWWFIVTQWFFGPPLIDRSFRWTGGKCQMANLEVQEGIAGPKEYLTAAACKKASGSWSGGHDISGHVFLMAQGSLMLMMESGWVMARWTAQLDELRNIYLRDGSVKSASVEAEVPAGMGRDQDAWRFGAKLVAVIVAVNAWMMLMTAMYFHTWFEKTTGLLTAYLGHYLVYYVPRFVPALREYLGMPGI